MGSDLSLDLDGALDPFEYHDENEYDAEGGKPSRVFVPTYLKYFLLPSEDILVALFAKDVWKRLQLTVGEAR